MYMILGIIYRTILSIILELLDPYDNITGIIIAGDTDEYFRR